MQPSFAEAPTQANAIIVRIRAYSVKFWPRTSRHSRESVCFIETNSSSDYLLQALVLFWQVSENGTIGLPCGQLLFLPQQNGTAAVASPIWPIVIGSRTVSRQQVVPQIAIRDRRLPSSVKRKSGANSFRAEIPVDCFDAVSLTPFS